ncbi:photosynthetic complex assembly protein PuhC [Rhodobacter lacus]|uniref:Photosynthetic complex assembly protein PuhC n=1 Tax=Rhodobacter lacus TaxID=1641972 RepID=A0ABW5A8H5_9RHOB
MAQHPVSARPGTPGKDTEKSKEMIPLAMVRAMIGAALLSLAIVGYSVATGRPHVGVPDTAKVLAERSVILEDVNSQHVIVRNPDGSVLVDMPDGGFVNVVGAAVKRTRVVQRIAGNPPIRIVRYENGRISAEDPATGWSAELYAFGPDSKAAFERLLDMN